MITKFFAETKLDIKDFYFANKSLDNELRQEALYDTKNEVYQAVEGMYHNLNTLQSRSGNQLPFSSINYGTCTLLEGRMVTKALLEVSMEGLGSNGVTSIFPCGIFQVKKGINKEPGTPNYDLNKHIRFLLFFQNTLFEQRLFVWENFIQSTLRNTQRSGNIVHGYALDSMY